MEGGGMEDRHYSVLKRESIAALRIRPDGIYVDGTLGLGGHSLEIAQRLTEGGRLIAVDRDARAMEWAAERLSPVAERVTVRQGNFRDLDRILSELNIEHVDGILLDLGVSSGQRFTTSQAVSPSASSIRISSGASLR